MPRRSRATSGFTIEADLNTERSRAAWLEWKRRSDPLHYLDPIKREAALRQVDRDMMAEGWIDPKHFYGTINCNGINAAGDICGVTTTSGLAWKIPGRVGDSPILGAGLYVDGARRRRRIHRSRRGQSVQPLLVLDRRGDAPRPQPEGRRHGSAQADPVEHGREAAAELARPAELRHQLLHAEREGRARRGDACTASNVKYAVCTENGAEQIMCDALLEGKATD